jgi:hypothetical protein
MSIDERFALIASSRFHACGARSASSHQLSPDHSGCNALVRSPHTQLDGRVWSSGVSEEFVKWTLKLAGGRGIDFF